MRAKRKAIFVDGSNFTAALRAAGYKMDYDTLLKSYREQGEVISACYFTALPPKAVFSPVRSLTDRLSYNGWTIVSKETKELLTDGGLFVTKGNMDVEMAVKAMKLRGRITDFVLCSGDGDFVSVVSAMQELGVYVTVISTQGGGVNLVADELRREANAFINLRFGYIRSKFELKPDKIVLPKRRMTEF